MFEINKEMLLETERVQLGEWTAPLINDLSRSIDRLAAATGCKPIQRGRVIALRQTNPDGLFTAFKSALYHERYDDMANTDRFIEQIAAAHCSNEPIRGESISFLFIGVGKPVYDALAMFGQGRLSRISGGFHHTVPWGVEAPMECRDPQEFCERMMTPVRKVAERALSHGVGAGDSELRVLRYEMPLCYIVPPFLMDFSEEALITKVFPQRLWEPGATKRESGVVVQNMWDCCCALDAKLFKGLYEFYGPHANAWQDALRALYASGMSLSELAERLEKIEDSSEISAYEALRKALGAIRPGNEK